MNLHLKRHKLLGILSKQRGDLKLRKADPMILGVSTENILKHLNCNEDELELITSELHTQDEIKYFNALGVRGLYAKPNGVSAFANKKYQRKIKDQWKERIKFILPFLALGISLASLYFSKITNITEDEFDKETKILKSEIDILKIHVNKLKTNHDNNPNENTHKDSLTYKKTDKMN